MTKIQEVINTKFYGQLEVLGLSAHRKDHIIVRCSCGVEKETNLYGVYRGETISCGCSRKGVKNLKVGQYFEGGCWGSYIVVKIKSSREVTLKFPQGHEGVFTSAQARSGSVWNRLHPTVSGVGCIGYGKYVSRIDNHKTPQYQCWENMISRCYYPKASRYDAYGGRGVTVIKEWLNFQNFAKWYDENYKDGYNLNKDILGDGRLYSPEFCRFIPESYNKSLNCSPTKLKVRGNDLSEGVYIDTRGFYVARYRNEYLYEGYSEEDASEIYNRVKTLHIRSVTEELYEKGSICEDVYKVMKNYKSKEGHK